MRKVFVWVSLSLCLLVALPAFAQEEGTLGPGEGSPIIYPNFGGDPTNVNPLLDNASINSDVMRWIWPSFVGLNSLTGTIDPGTPGTLAESWEVSEDGRTYTFTLRDDWTWSDGTPITSADIKYAYDAIVSGEIDTPLAGYLSTVESLEAPDPQTVVMTFSAADCSALSSARVLTPVPAHVFTELFGTDYALMNDSDFNLNPTVTAGSFSFGSFRPGEQVTVLANQDYPDSQFGYVVPEGMIFRLLDNQTLIVEQFLNGEVTLIDSVPEDRQAELEALAEAGEIQMHKGLSSGWMFVGFNVADPTNPQDAVDADGNPLDQGNHPLFGDVRVRQAFALSINHDALNEGAFAGNSIAIGSPVLMDSWAYNDAIEPWPYDPEAAMALLEEAGWIDDDNNPDTPRVAQGALYAPDGTPLTFELLSFAGNTSVDSVAVLMQDQLRQTGFEMNLDIIEFGSMIEKLDGQTFDASLLFFGGFDATNPDEQKDLFTSLGDIVGSGFNSGSYNNPEVLDLYTEARTLPGCDQAERKAIYDQIQQIIRDEVPMYFVGTSIVPVVVRGDMLNFEPRELSWLWNLPSWSYQLEP